MNQAQAIALYQPILQTIAYNLLKCKADAEDVVQDTLLKWLTIDQTKIDNTKAYLIKSVTNNCLNHLNALKRKKEEYWDSMHLSDILVKFKDSDFAHFDFEKELAAAYKLVHAKLEPLERAAFLLREVFDFDYPAIQQVLDKKADHCRQLISRAKKKMTEESDKISKMKFELPNANQMFESFRNACTLDNAQEFVQHLKEDISKAISKKGQ